MSGFTSLSRLSVTVVMTPVFGWMENRFKPSRRVYRILTWLVSSWSLSVAFSFPTMVPAAVKRGQDPESVAARSCRAAFLTCFALLRHRHLQRAREGGGVVVHVVYDDAKGQRIVQLLVGDQLENSDSQLEEKTPEVFTWSVQALQQLQPPSALPRPPQPSSALLDNDLLTLEATSSHAAGGCGSRGR